MYEITQEPLNEFAPNSHGRRVWSLVETSLKVKVTDKKRHFSTLLQFVFGKTFLASSFVYEISPESLNGFAPNSHGRQLTCLVPHLVVFEGRGQKSKVKVTMDKKRHFSAIRQPACGLCLVKNIFSI